MRRRGQAGVTVLEGILVAGLASLLIGLAFRLAADADAVWKARHAEMNASRQGWEWTHRIAEELRAALPGAEFGSQGAFRCEDGAATYLDVLAKQDRAEEIARELGALPVDLDGVRFATARGRRPDGSEGAMLVEYRLARDAEGRALGLERRIAGPGEELARAQPTLVAPLVRSFSVECMDAAGRWRTTWTDGSALPAAVRIELAAEGPAIRGMPQRIRFVTAVDVLVGTRVRR